LFRGFYLRRGDGDGVLFGEEDREAPRLAFPLKGPLADFLLLNAEVSGPFDLAMIHTHLLFCYPHCNKMDGVKRIFSIRY
jgi:hypothetical protein